MRIQNLKAPQETAIVAGTIGPAGGHANGHDAPAAAPAGAAAGGVAERQALEIALLKARNQHLELMVETARSLMGSNQERLLRRLHEVPHEIATLSAQLRRIDPAGSW